MEEGNNLCFSLNSIKFVMPRSGMQGAVALPAIGRAGGMCRAVLLYNLFFVLVDNIMFVKGFLKREEGGRVKELARCS